MGASAFERAQKFAADLTRTVQGVLPESPRFRAMASEFPFVQISVFEGAAARIAKLPLFVSGEHVGDWKLSMSVNLDSSGGYLKVMRSNFSLFADPERIPLVRYEFDDDMRTAPIAHWQFHGERGAFSYLLGRAAAAGRPVVPHSLSSIHFPVGGARMRPGVDDLLEFMVRECGVDTCPRWKEAIQESRADYRLIQARTVARDAQAAVADVLREQGWTVVEPDAVPEVREKLVRSW